MELIRQVASTSAIHKKNEIYGATECGDLLSARRPSPATQILPDHRIIGLRQATS
jgi:hypothetical protein